MAMNVAHAFEGRNWRRRWIPLWIFVFGFVALFFIWSTVLSSQEIPEIEDVGDDWETSQKVHCPGRCQPKVVQLERKCEDEESVTTDTADTTSLVDKILRLERKILLAKRGVESSAFRSKDEESEASKLDSMILDRLEGLQNPKDCSKAKFLLCDVREESDAASLIHALAKCQHLAFYSNRVAEVYLNQNEPDPDSLANMGSGEQFSLKLEDDVSQYWIPKDVEKGLKHFEHPNPALWFFGRLVAHVMRTSAFTDGEIASVLSGSFLDIENPPAFGLFNKEPEKGDVRHMLGEFLYPMDRHRNPDTNYRSAYGKNCGVKVFVVDRSGSLFQQVSKYEQYSYIQLTRTNSEDELAAFLADLAEIILLSRTQLFVGTFSTLTSRIVYELLAAKFLHAYYIVESLDVGWFLER